MDYHLEKVDDMIIYLATLRINASIETVWNLVATTQGYATWFPEIEIHHDDDEVHFISPEFDDIFQLIEYKHASLISYTWDSATVSFSLQHDAEGVLVLFEENLPTDFENMSRDITGWHVQLLRLKSVAEKKSASFDTKLFNSHKVKVEDQLNSLMS